MMTGRGLLLLLAIGASLLPESDRAPGSVQLAVLVDRSDSVTPPAAARARERLTEDIDAFGKEMSVSTSEFRAQALSSGLAEVIRDALWRFEPASRGGIVVISDGYWQADIAGILERTVSAGIPVFWLPTERGDLGPRILRIDAPERARAGQRIAVSVDVEAPENREYSVLLHANGQPVARRALLRNEATTLQLTVPSVAALQIDAELIDTDTGDSLHRLQSAALVNVVSAPHLLLVTNGYSPIAESLAAGGWSVARMSTAAFAGLNAPISDYSALLLEDVATSDLPAARWSQIVAAVRRDALGLLVLGGPNSFGLGAYRGSELEEVLPVISEPPDDETPASVLFLVDVSGSMGRETGGSNSLLAAREAVLHSAAALRPVDRVGLIGFDIQALQLLAPATRDDHVSAIRRAWPQQASGGTSVLPALDLAGIALADDPAEQKLLVLVTDGMLPAEDLAELEGRLREGDFELIAIVISDRGDDVPLSRITLGDRGSLFIVDDVLRLPALMRDEVENLRPALVTERTSPALMSSPPLSGPAVDWPPLDAYLVTRARPEATVMLAAGGGEPLMAAWSAGAGRVIALTGGLNQWAGDWIAWDRWPELVGGLVGYVAVTNSGVDRIEIDKQPSNRLAIAIDTGTPQATAHPVAARLLSPAGDLVKVALAPEAPGRYGASIAAPQAGQYTLLWENDVGVSQHRFLQMPERESVLAGEPLARRYVAEGLLEEWSHASARKIAGRAHSKAAVIAIALLLLLLTIAAERVPLKQGIRMKSGRYRTRTA